MRISSSRPISATVPPCAGINCPPHSAEECAVLQLTCTPLQGAGLGISAQLLPLQPSPSPAAISLLQLSCVPSHAALLSTISVSSPIPQSLTSSHFLAAAHSCDLLCRPWSSTTPSGERLQPSPRPAATPPWMGCERRIGRAQSPHPRPLCSTQVITDCKWRHHQQYAAHHRGQK